MKTFCCILCLLVVLPASAQKKQAGKHPLCPPGTVYPIRSTTADDYSDLRFLKPLVQHKRVVLLGESSHGIGDYYALKSRLVKYLHSECDFEVVSLESGIADIHLAYRETDTISAEKLRNQTVYGNFQCREIMPLFNYIKQTAATAKPLLYTGFDSQNFTASLQLLRKILNEFSDKNGDSLINNISLYYKIPSLLWQEDRSPLYQLGDTIKTSALVALAVLNRNIPEVKTRFHLSDLDIRFMQRALQNHIAAAETDWRTEDPSAKRDSLMADNLFWLMNEIYPGKKVVVWAHNGHIDR
ncbi:MAG: erythromycin esterase family protein, partial [Dinghuibacter sp.]|nr:erythromycin esterase family protein [Dinghuibacter sp.]